MINSDLRYGVRRNWRVGASLSGVAGAGGATAGAALGLGALALAGGLVILPAVAGAAMGWEFGAIDYRALYQYYLKR